ncbi:MAG: endonuclease/exonuclease/phosphatase family protein [Burkholderiales bacterium]|nr:endonuclease/exonuclease/phosphatase family protein [Burkholderiales bacterium]
MKLLSWNIQWCRGMDGRVDPGRIAHEARRIADPDVICLQEVAQGFADLAGSSGEDQPALLAREFEGYEAHYAFAVDLPGSPARARFGNLILSRLPVRQVFRHSLPWPADPGVASMPRVALEAVIETSFGPVRVLTVHLEYYSARQRAAQVERLRELHEEACAHARAEPPASAAGPFRPLPRPRSAIVCGDFNFAPDDPLHARLQAPFTSDTPRLLDAWPLANPGAPHSPTFRLYDREYRGAPYCCDFVFVTEDLAPRIASARVYADTQASDHQPVAVNFA